ncbi:MAG TPA: YncE family protein [Phycisphaerae bacterium]|nr:YncE family protein [Phycisphaerae bacterium]
MASVRLSGIGVVAFSFLFLLGGIATAQEAEKPAKSSEGAYRILKTFDVGGEGGWDYLTVDPDARRLYVSHAMRVAVLDADSGKVVGEIADTPGVHGIALVPELNRGFISNGRAATATIFDLKSLKAIDSVKTGENPDAIVYEPTTKRVFTMNGRSSDTTAIDAASGKVVGKIDLGGKPEFAVADGAGKLFVNIEDKSEIAVLDPKELKVTARWSSKPGEEPSGLALDVKNHRLFSVCGNKMMVIVDAENGKVLTTLPIGEHVDGAAFDPATGLAYSSNGDGTLTIVREESPEKFVILENVPTQRGARTIALDPKTHNVFLPTAEFEPTPPAAKDTPRQRPTIRPGTFKVLVVGK